MTQERPAAVPSEADRRRDRLTRRLPGHATHLRTAARALVDSLPRDGVRPSTVVDLACGSGASTKALMTELFEDGVRFALLSFDASAALLDQALAHDWPRAVTFDRATPEVVPSQMRRHRRQIDGALAAHAMSEVAQPAAWLDDLRDALTPGAPLVLLEIGPSARWTRALQEAGFDDVWARTAPGMFGRAAHTIHGRRPR